MIASGSADECGDARRPHNGRGPRHDVAKPAAQAAKGIAHGQRPRDDEAHGGTPRDGPTDGLDAPQGRLLVVGKRQPVVRGQAVGGRGRAGGEVDGLVGEVNAVDRGGWPLMAVERRVCEVDTVDRDGEGCVDGTGLAWWRRAAQRAVVVEARVHHVRAEAAKGPAAVPPRVN